MDETAMMPAPATKLEVTDRHRPRRSRHSCAASRSKRRGRARTTSTRLPAIAPAGTRVYLSAVLDPPAGRKWSRRRRCCGAAGLEPVPHLAVRNFASV